MENPKIDFLFSPPSTEHCIVFNEIMADPYPVEGLPNCEYIELTNRSDYAVAMDEWNLEIGDRHAGIPEMFLLPDEILLVCGKGKADSLQNFGQVIEVDRFSINNSGVLFRLLYNGSVIDEFNYSPLIHDPEFRDGGRSLERVDTDRTCGQEKNWKTSNSFIGGTPGEKNSVSEENMDNSSPELLSVRVVSDNKLVAVFSENIVKECLLPDNIQFVGTLPAYDSIRYDRNSQKLMFYFPENTIKSGEKYALKFEKLIDACGNLNSDISEEFSFYNPAYGEVLISEVLFNPKQGQAEFVEIYNNSPTNVDLSRMFIASRNNFLELKQVCKISENELLTAPGTYLALTGDSISVSQSYFTECGKCIVEMDKFPVLNNEKGRVVLLNGKLQVVDEFIYSDDMHHDLIADTKGVSLERKSFINYTNEPGNWHSASSGTGYATPGYANSLSGTETKASSVVTVSPEIFSPNDDGYNDNLGLIISTGEAGWIANVRLFTPEGYEVCRLAGNRLIAPEEFIEWDGCDENNQKQDLGIYLILVELFHPDGRKKRYQYPCVITDRSM
jgi:hypothetical protein